MTTQQAIEKAIEGGWDSGFPSYWSYKVVGTTPNLVKFADKSGHERFKHLHRILLDPFFWQALGKVLGWEAQELYIKENPDFPEGESVMQEGWLYYQHRFIDHLAEGKSIESYFEQVKE